MNEEEKNRPPTPPPASAEVLSPDELFWVDLQPWLQQSGYTLRPRFRPGWIPSWKTPGPNSILGEFAEDGWPLIFSQIMDAVRDADGIQVALKRVSTKDHRFEEGIHSFISGAESELLGDPKNHCVPLLEVLQHPTDPDIRILVMQLIRKYNNPPFDTIGEVVDFFHQIFEGLQFMHKHLIAHRDCLWTNIMMSPGKGMYPDGFHPQFQGSTLDMTDDARHFTRTQRPPRYTFIDFGISVRFSPGQRHVAEPIGSGDRTVPEYQNLKGVKEILLDPFATDIYLLGNLILGQFLEARSGALQILAEDSRRIMRAQIMDAVRDSDGARVVLKQVYKSAHPLEEGIHRFLSTPGSELSGDPTNHCAPPHDVLQSPDPDLQILVLDLMRKYDSPPFDTVGEAVDFFQQIFEGLQFMHKHLVAHRDCSSNNIMMSAPQEMFPDGFHPQYQERSLDLKDEARALTRTQQPPKYYLIDFGISLRFSENEPRSALPIVGADRTVPEYQNDGHLYAQDPFATDIYFLGNLIREEFMDGQFNPTYLESPGRAGFEFMRPLVVDMVNVDPKKRPTIDQAVLRFEKIKNGLSTWKLRILGHWKRKIGYITNGTPPIPVYRG
ncbi:hypothetical protein C8R46DRAFT_1353155 [Mycena filopes]|nr:hypothetical protein C8R46DRAFT_1353155 [Mycena filopes]